MKSTSGTSSIFITTIFFIVVILIIRVIAIEVSAAGCGVNESKHSVVLPETLNRVPNNRHVATPGTSEGCVGRSREHLGKTIFAEAMAALKQ
jgi:hypothetical protein